MNFCKTIPIIVLASSTCLGIVTIQPASATTRCQVAGVRGVPGQKDKRESFWASADTPQQCASRIEDAVYRWCQSFPHEGGAYCRSDQSTFSSSSSDSSSTPVTPPAPHQLGGNGNSNPSYILETPGQPAIAVFESRRESFALGCPEIRDAWGVTDRRGVSSDNFQRVLRANPVVADLPCNGSIQWMKLSDEPPQLLWIRHRDGQMCRHYINSTKFPKALRYPKLEQNDGPTFRAAYPCRGNDFRAVNP